jgi:hypothetical protein
MIVKLSCFITKTGYPGLAEPGVSPTGKVIILLGGEMPFILRDTLLEKVIY